MKFAFNYFKSICRDVKAENLHILVITAAVAGLIIGIPFMFIGGFAVLDLLIPVIVAASCAALAASAPLIFCIVYFFQNYRAQRVFNKYGICDEYLDIVKKKFDKQKSLSLGDKLMLANLYRDVGKFREAEKSFEEIPAEELNDELKEQYIILYLLLALQTRNFGLYDTLYNKYYRFIYDRNTFRHIEIYCECVMINYDQALELCEQCIDDNSDIVGYPLYSCMAYLFTKMGLKKEAEASADLAYELIGKETAKYDYWLPSAKRRVEKALAGELVPPFTQA